MLAVIGGTGLYELPELEVESRGYESTPFGDTSGEIVTGRWQDRPILFLARHGAGHRLLPHEINYRANIFALKRAGATCVLGCSAVGSLAIEIRPGDLAIPEQYFDWTRGSRERTFFGRGIAAHVSTAKPVSAALVSAVCEVAAEQGCTIHRGLSYACVEGPRLGTQVESHFLRQVGCQLVGMTNIPEVFLAREAQLAYATLGLVTDYDCWLEDPAQHVSAMGIFALYQRTLQKANAVLQAFLPRPLPPLEPESREALSMAVLTPENAIEPSQKAWLEILRR